MRTSFLLIVTFCLLAACSKNNEISTVPGSRIDKTIPIDSLVAKFNGNRIEASSVKCLFEPYINGFALGGDIKLNNKTYAFTIINESYDREFTNYKPYLRIINYSDTFYWSGPFTGELEITGDDRDNIAGVFNGVLYRHITNLPRNNYISYRDTLHPDSIVITDGAFKARWTY